MEIDFEIEPGRVSLMGEVINQVDVLSDERGQVKRSGYKILTFEVRAKIYGDWVNVTKSLSSSHLERLKHSFCVYVETKKLDDLQEELNNLF